MVKIRNHKIKPGFIICAILSLLVLVLVFFILSDNVQDEKAHLLVMEIEDEKLTRHEFNTLYEVFGPTTKLQPEIFLNDIVVPHFILADQAKKAGLRVNSVEVQQSIHLMQEENPSAFMQSDGSSIDLEPIERFVGLRLLGLDFIAKKTQLKQTSGANVSGNLTAEQAKKIEGLKQKAVREFITQKGIEMKIVMHPQNLK